MLEAALWGFVGGLALVIGALVGILAGASQRLIAVIMAFGSGVLISALAFELTADAFERGGSDAVGVGIAAGALTFFAGDMLIDRSGGHDRKRSGGQQKHGSANAIVIGAILDGVPESIAIGVSLLEGAGVSTAVVAAVFLSNLPESLSAATGLRKAGHSARWIIMLWLIVAIVCGLASALGYKLLGNGSPNNIAFIQAFAAGAILTMLADTMMPESFQEGGKTVGLFTCLGFALAFFLSQAQ